MIRREEWQMLQVGLLNHAWTWMYDSYRIRWIFLEIQGPSAPGLSMEPNNDDLCTRLLGDPRCKIEGRSRVCRRRLDHWLVSTDYTL